MAPRRPVPLQKLIGERDHAKEARSLEVEAFRWNQLISECKKAISEEKKSSSTSSEPLLI